MTNLNVSYMVLTLDDAWGEKKVSATLTLKPSIADDLLKHGKMSVFYETLEKVLWYTEILQGRYYKRDGIVEVNQG